MKKSNGQNEIKVSGVQFCQLKSDAERLQYLQTLMNNPEWKQELNYQDKADLSGKNIDEMKGKIDEYSKKLDLDKQKYGQVVYDKCISLRRPKGFTKDIGADKRKDKLNPSQFSVYHVKTEHWEHGGSKINEVDLRDLLFREEKLFAGLDVDHLGRGSYWVKTGPLLFSFAAGGKSSFEVSISYIDMKAKNQIHLMNIKCPREDLGMMVKKLMPFDISFIGSGTYIGPASSRLLGKAFENAHFAEITEVLRKLFLDITHQKEAHDTQTDINKLRPYLISYDLGLRVLVKNYGKSSTQFEEKLSETSEDESDIKTQTGQPKFHNSKYFMDRENPHQIDEPPVNNQEVIEKIVGVYFLNYSISDVNIKAILYQYFAHEKCTITTVDDIDVFVRQIYKLKLEFERCNMSFIIAEEDFKIHALNAWGHYFVNKPKGKNNFPLDKSDFDMEFQGASPSSVPEKKTTGVKTEKYLCEVLLYPDLGARILYAKIKTKFPTRASELDQLGADGKPIHNRGKIAVLLNVALKILQEEKVFVGDAKFTNFNVFYQDNVDKNKRIQNKNGYFIQLNLRDLYQLHDFLDYEVYHPAHPMDYSAKHIANIIKLVKLLDNTHKSSSRETILEEINELCSGESVFIKDGVLSNPKPAPTPVPTHTGQTGFLSSLLSIFGDSGSSSNGLTTASQLGTGTKL